MNAAQPNDAQPNDARTGAGGGASMRRMVVRMVFVALAVWAIASMRSCWILRDAAHRGNWFQGALADGVMLVLGPMVEQDLHVYDVGPKDGGEVHHDEDFAVDGAAALVVYVLPHGEGLRFAVLAHPEPAAAEPFDAERWAALQGADRLPLALGLAQGGKVSGDAAATLLEALGTPDRRLRYLEYRVSDGQGTDPRRFPLDADRRVDHDLPLPDGAERRRSG